MKFYADLPFKYEGAILKQPPFNLDGTITQRTSIGLENSLFLYSGLAKLYALDTENNPRNFLVNDIFVVGSGARQNKIHSDLDILLITPDLDIKSGGDLKRMMSFVLFNDREKNEALDVFIRPFDKYPDRDSIKITSQVLEKIQRYNQLIVSE